MKKFTDFSLDKNILRLLEEIGYEEPTPIQQQAIPEVLSGSDVIASAQTGTGKTGAFMLPTLSLLVHQTTGKWNGPRVLILVPTRELAMQVAAESKKFSKYLSRMRTVCIYGGVPYPVQKRELSRPYDVLVATPGRLIDHMQQGRIHLSSLSFLILDEADRMLDMGFVDSVEQVAAASPQERQTLLFSATLDQKIINFSKKLQRNPFEIRVKPVPTEKPNIEQTLYYVDNVNHKLRLLENILQTTEIEQAIIFTSTINQAIRLAEDLSNKGYLSAALHGNMNQRQRTRTIEKLRRGLIHILVATDVAARGIDVATLSHVFNFDLPFQSEDFVHRVGRTGRAGAQGSAITFATYKEKKMLLQIDKHLAKPLKSSTIAGMEPKAESFSGGSQGPRMQFRKRRFPQSKRTKSFSRSR